MIEFKSLKVWELSHQITLESYLITKDFPKEEIYGLIQQIRRSSSSIPTNIAEGCGRGSDKELIRYLRIAMGSACELEYQMILSKDLNYLNDEVCNSMIEKIIQIKKMLNAFINKLNQRLKQVI